MRGLITIAIHRRKATSKSINCGVCGKKILPEFDYGVRVIKGRGKFPFHLECASGMLNGVVSYNKQSKLQKRTARLDNKKKELIEYEEAKRITDLHIKHYKDKGWWWTFTEDEEALIHKFVDLVIRLVPFVNWDEYKSRVKEKDNKLDEVNNGLDEVNNSDE